MAVESLGDRTQLEASRGTVGRNTDGGRVTSEVGMDLKKAQGSAEGQGQLVWKQQVWKQCWRAARPMTHVQT